MNPRIIENPAHLADLRVQAGEAVSGNLPRFLVGMATCGLASGAQAVYDALRAAAAGNESSVVVAETGCNGACYLEPLVDVILPGQGRITYANVRPDDAQALVESTLKGTAYPKRALARMDSERNFFDDILQQYGNGNIAPEVGNVPLYSQTAFFRDQMHIAMRNCGTIDPESLDEYIGRGGYAAAAKALTQMTLQEAIDTITRSGLRGRGGGGFPTGRKWDTCRKAHGEPKYVICNADEGDPGAYMDRSIVEGDPHSVIEGMIIGSYAVGANQGFVYVREEYPLAVKRIKRAIAQAEERGLLGKNILGSGHDFSIRVNRGAGAFVCGESTALMASLEGRVGEPRAKYIHTVESGLWGKPSCLNNVETWNNVPVIIARGAEWFSSIGTEKSKGTKVFSLVGKVNRVGLVEVPMGVSLRQVVEEIGGGIPDGRALKAIQTGGPSGGCIPAEHLDTPVDFDNLSELGSMMGSGGMIVMDDRTCMVDVARYFLAFLKDESCGKCVPCREGTSQMLDILTNICEGRGNIEDIDLLRDLAEGITDGSLCALGSSAPNPVLTTLKYFEQEYRDHIVEKRCPAKVCRPLIHYRIDREKCTACSLCARACPEQVISGDRENKYAIAKSGCVKCGICLDSCRFNAVVVE